MSNDNIPADAENDAWAQPGGNSVLTFIEIEGRLVKYEDRDPQTVRKVRDSVTRINLMRSDADRVE